LEIRIDTQANRELSDVTDKVTSLVAGLADGLLILSAPHTTVALFVSEIDEELRRDYLKIADRLFAPIRPFEHIRKNNPNTEAHVLSAMLGTSLVLPVAAGSLALGTYQRILLFELDGPKTRTIRATHFRSSTD
jgi:secondary thiamine-phosphate synthase enzyme